MKPVYNAQDRFVQFADRLADEAGEVVRRHFRSPLEIVRKEDASPVTQVDREVESAVRRFIEREFPAHGIFGEEHGRKNEHAEYQWVIDPIDGTRSFIAGYLTFTTLIALVKDGAPIIGVIDQPILRERWVGVKGAPTRLNKKIVQAAGITQLKDAVISTTSLPYYFDAKQTPAFERLRKECAHVVLGGDAYGYAMLASGRIGVFVDACLKPYDFSALVPVVEGAGGVITDWQGNPLTLSGKGDVVAAANKTLHQQALQILQSQH